MKGDVSLPFIGLAATLVIIIGILIPTKFMAVPTTRVVKYEQTHNNAQTTLISLLSSTENGKTIQELIGEHIILGEPKKEDLEKLLKERLDRMVVSKCYGLTSSSGLKVESSGCEPKDYKKEIEISLPFNPDQMTEKITLVMN